jgi:hypothetical protein
MRNRQSQTSLKTICGRHISTSYWLGKRKRAFLLKPGMIQGCALSPCLFNIMLEILEKVILQEKNKRDRSRKGRIHTASIFRYLSYV